MFLNLFFCALRGTTFEGFLTIFLFCLCRQMEGIITSAINASDFAFPISSNGYRTVENSRVQENSAVNPDEIQRSTLSKLNLSQL